MRHHATSNANHWAVGYTGDLYFDEAGGQVLVQVQENGQQARIPLTPEQAEAMAEQLLEFAQRARAAVKGPVLSCNSCGGVLQNEQGKLRCSKCGAYVTTP